MSRKKKSATFAADDAAVAAVRCLIGSDWPAGVCRALTCPQCNAVLVWTDSRFKWGKGTKRDQYWSCPNLHGQMIGEGSMLVSVRRVLDELDKERTLSSNFSEAKIFLSRLREAQRAANEREAEQRRGPTDAPAAELRRCPQCLFESLLTDDAAGVERCLFAGCGYRHELEKATP